MRVKRVINKAFTRDMMADLFLHQNAFCFDRHFLRIYREVLEGGHGGRLNSRTQTRAQN